MMNSLNLRVSSVKTGENIKKNSEMRSKLVNIPEEYLKNTELRDIINPLANASTIPEQVNICKKIHEKYSDDEIILQFLSDLYFNSPLKHPVRNQLKRLFQQSSHHNNNNNRTNVIIKIFSNRIIELLRYENEINQENCINLNIKITSISECFDNFDLAKKSFENNISLIFPFLCISLEKYMKNLSISESPSIKNELYLFIHNDIRLILLCVQEFSSILFTTKHNSYNTYEKEIENLLNISNLIILDNDQPMDVRTNCGILIAYIKLNCLMNVNDGDDDNNKIEIILLNLLELDKLKNNNDYYKICLYAGIVNTIKLNEIIKFTKCRNQIKQIVKDIIHISDLHSNETCLLLACTRLLYQLSKNLLLLLCRYDDDGGDDDDDDYNNFEIELINDISKILINFILNYIENNMDTIRHTCKDLLKNILKLQYQIFKLHNKNDDDTVKNLLFKIYKNDVNVSIKCKILICISQIFGTKYILEYLPNIQNDLFLKQIGYDVNINACYEILMLRNYDEYNFEIWKNIWIKPLIDNLIKINNEKYKNQLQEQNHQIINNNDRLQIIENLINKAIKYDNKLIMYIMNTMKDDNDDNDDDDDEENDHDNNNSIKKNPDNDDELPLSTYLSVLWTIRKNGIEYEVNFNEIFKKFYKKLKFAIISNDSNLKMIVLCLLIETHKKTELLTKIELDLLILYLKYNSNVQNSSIRQKCINLYIKLLNRIELNIQKQIKYKIYDKDNDKYNNDNIFKEFLINLSKILFNNLFIGANHNRKLISLHLLNEMIKILIKNQLCIIEYLPSSIKYFQRLFNCLDDSYEINKILSLEIMKMIENQLKMKLYNKLNLNTIENLMKSVKPTDSITAAYHLEYYCHLIDCTNSNEILKMFNLNSNEEIPKYCPIYYGALKWCLDILKDGLKIAEQSIILTSKLNPLYGILFSVRHLMSKITFKMLSNDKIWIKLINEIIKISKKCSKIVEPIVNNSSPEGHLPNDFTDIPDYLKFEECNDDKFNGKSYIKILSNKNLLKNDEIMNMKITPQMILLCSWRTIKEISLILGEIVYNSFIKETKITEKYVIEIDEIYSIGNHFIELLLETKHRGAFEQAYVGFLKVCSRLWTVYADVVNQLPMKWLKELIETITFLHTDKNEKNENENELNHQNIKMIKNNEKICATRRSAGVPFMIQAIIISELQVGTTKSLHYCMKHLILVCTQRNSIDNELIYSIESRTHALNIMRALFRCKNLGEIITEYISDGVQCAINGYSANTWVERNSSTLLFSTLITRIFGVQRTKDSDNLNIRNKMTGRIFFLRYPKLYDYFLNELNYANDKIKNNHNINKLHPLLIILSRLYPSALEGTESNLKLSAFIPLISICSRSPIMQTRILTAKAIVAFMPSNLIFEYIKENLMKILQQSSKDQQYNNDSNSWHGIFLQIFFLIKVYNKLKIDDANFIIIEISKLIIKNQYNAVIIKTILDIFIEIFNRINLLNLSEDSIKILQYLGYQLLQNNVNTNYSNSFQVYRKSLFIYNLYLLFMFTYERNAVEKILNYFVSPALNSIKTYEDTETSLNILLLLFKIQKNLNNEIEWNLNDDIQNQFEYTKQEIDFVMAVLKFENIQYSIIKEFQNNKILLLKFIKTVIYDRYFYPECCKKAYALLSYLLDNKNENENENENKDDYEIIYFISESKKYPNNMKYTISMCIEKLLNRINTLNNDEKKIILNYLQEISQPWNSDLLRKSASNILREVSKYVHNEIVLENYEFLSIFSIITLKLLIDDNCDVRTNISEMVLIHFSNENQTLPDKIISTYALEIYLKFLVKAIEKWSESSLKYLIENILNAQKQYDNDTVTDDFDDDDDDDDLEIFNKNEVNTYGEMKMIENIFIEIFLNYFLSNDTIYKFILEFKNKTNNF